MAHAALTCSGATPRYFTPGFGPLALAWGWLLLGVLLGLLSRRAAEAIVGLTSGRQLPHTPWSWEALLRELSARTQDPSRHEVLQYLLQRGEAALVELSIGAHAGFFAGSPMVRLRNRPPGPRVDGRPGRTSVRKVDATSLPRQASWGSRPPGPAMRH